MASNLEMTELEDCIDRLNDEVSRIRDALRQVRDLFIVEYGSDPSSRPSVGYDSEALPKIVAILDAALPGKE